MARASRRVEYTFIGDDGDFDVEARIDGVRVGYVCGVKTADRLLLADLLVYEAVTPRWPVFPWLLLKVLGPRRPWRPRGRGIGRGLLARLLREADATGVREVWGSVTEADLQETPHLLAWYERRGFAVVDPDGACVGGAVRKIVRQRPGVGDFPAESPVA